MGFEDKVDEDAIRQSISKRDFEKAKKALEKARIPEPWVLTASGIKNLEKMMEEMANAPKEELGVRQPGERCAYEIQRMGREQGKEIK